MQSEALPQKQGSRSVAGWLISAIVGTIIAFFTSGIVIPMIFGIQRRDSASVWGLSGVADLFIGFLSLPAFLVAHAIAFAAINPTGLTTSWRAARSVMIGLVIFWVVIAVVWQHHGGGKVLRAQ